MGWGVGFVSRWAQQRILFESEFNLNKILNIIQIVIIATIILKHYCYYFYYYYAHKLFLH
jgi:hypothetical protein